MKKTSVLLLVLACASFACLAPTQAGTLVDMISVPGESADLTPGVVGVQAAVNRLNFGSDIWYDSTNHLLYGVGDAGPAGDWFYESRVQVFNLEVDPTNGKLNNFQLVNTIRFKTADGSQNFFGGRPTLINGNPNTLGNCLDPEGFAVAPNGNMYVSDEWGPSIYEFTPVTVNGQVEARFVRSFNVPDRWIPKQADGTPNYEAGTPTVVSGAQNGRRLEGLSLSADGKTLTVAMQCPMQDEGGRTARTVRLGTFDVATGDCTGEYAYQLESLADINARISPDTSDFKANQQGRNISVNALVDLGGGKYLILERDNRGLGTANPINADPVLSMIGTKRVYEIDIAGATDISSLALPANGDLAAAGIVPVPKSLYLDIDQTLKAAGLPTVEKFEGMVLVQGDKPFILLANDNDYSVYDPTDPVTGEVSIVEVLKDGTQLPINTDLGGRPLIPSNLYSIAVPEPGTVTLLVGALLATAFASVRRRRK